MKIAILSVALLALIQIGLGIAVSVCRRRYKISWGSPDDPAHPLTRIRTAFSNCAEWHPIFYALLLVLPMGGAPKWSVWMAPVVVAARCLITVGLATFTLDRPNMMRVAGAGLTYLSAIVLTVLVLIGFMPTTT